MPSPLGLWSPRCYKFSIIVFKEVKNWCPSYQTFAITHSKFMKFYGGNTNFHPLGIFITCHAMSIMCNSQPNSFQNKSSTIRAQYNTNLLAKFHTLDIFREGNFNKRYLTWQYDISIHKSRDRSKENRISSPYIKMHPTYQIAISKKNFGFSKKAEVPKCDDDAKQMKFSFIYMRPSRLNY